MKSLQNYLVESASKVWSYGQTIDDIEIIKDFVDSGHTKYKKGQKLNIFIGHDKPNKPFPTIGLWKTDENNKQIYTGFLIADPEEYFKFSKK